MLTYFKVGKETLVRLDGKAVGEIRAVQGGFQYFPKGQKTGGEVFASLRACQQSLSNPDDEG